ncbi:hypothetical protein EV363DRAFT_1360315 [Boletus edulis]|nr:hypothetical protein EV363DRAFT_1360315 [Boletus edulis]
MFDSQRGDSCRIPLVPTVGGWEVSLVLAVLTCWQGAALTAIRLCHPRRSGSCGQFQAVPQKDRRYRVGVHHRSIGRLTWPVYHQGCSSI